MPRFLVTSALPYANGPIHFGHVAGAYLPADVYVRTLRQKGEEALFICGTDEYGVAITINAESAGQPYAEYVAHWHEEIHRVLSAIGIEFDIFSGTSVSEFHAPTSQDFFRRLDENGYLQKHSTEQLYCPKDQMFLADRYVSGTCYVCGTKGARGDECPKCGTWLDVLRLGDPICKVCGTTPERRTTLHWYLDMPRLRDEFIGGWIEVHEWKPNVRAFVTNMLKDVPKRPITRDMKWGVPVPADRAAGERGKVLYVWFDAPIGYVSFTKELFARRGEPERWRDWWQSNETRLVHFIGKDNIPHHCMLFPAMLHGMHQSYVLPWQVPANEFYNLQGRKFSTSGHWFIDLDAFFQRHDAEAARFAILASLPETADSEFSWPMFQRVVNTQLVGTIGNLVTRVLKFIEKHHEARIPALAAAHAAELDHVLLQQCGAIGDPAEHVLAFRFRQAVETLVANATVANVFVDRLAPWALRKSDPERAASVLATLCDYLGWIARWTEPFMPGKSQRLWEMLGQSGPVTASGWPGTPRAGGWRFLPAGAPLGAVGALFTPIDDATVQGETDELGGPDPAPTPP